MDRDRKNMDTRIIRLINKIKPYPYVSFDLFDTVLKRNVKNPDDIFRIVQRELQKYEKQFPGISQNFYERRILAEKEARTLSPHNEITLDEIYRQLPLQYRNIAMNEELAVEMSFISRNKFLEPVLTWCKKNKKKILFVSDIYLSADQIKRMLVKAGISGYTLFVSSEYRETKRGGELYDIVLKEMGIQPSELVHIGDSFRSDFIAARRKGIVSVWINRRQKNTEFNVSGNSGELDDSISEAFLNNHVYGKTDYGKFGYECMGPLMYGFCQWLRQEANLYNVNKIFFLAREGKFFQKAFEVLYPAKKRTDYLMVSRHSILTALLCKKESLKERLESLPLPHQFSLDKLYKILELPSEDVCGGGQIVIIHCRAF